MIERKETRVSRARFGTMQSSRRLSRLSCLLTLAFVAGAVPLSAQVSFRQAIALTLQNNPRVKSAQNDLAKAKAGVSIAKDIYIPSVVVGGGLGDSYGITLTVPTIFTVSAQSLVFSFQQRSYSKAAHFDLQAAKLALDELREQAEEDAAITYISLQSAEQIAATLREQHEYAVKLGNIMQDRLKADLETEIEVKKYQRGAIQIQLAMLQAQDNVEDLRGHLSQICGLPTDQMKLAPSTIPLFDAAEVQKPEPSGAHETPGILAAQATEKAKEMRAHGDAQYTWRPQVGFGATYGRISPIQNVEQFYNLNGNYNTVSAGIAVQFPILDLVRHQAAVQSKLDAQRAGQDLASMRSDAAAGLHKLARSLPELSAKVELAQLDYELARNAVASVELQAQHATGDKPITPKEVMDAHIEERQKFADLLDAKLQSAKSAISYLRLSGRLDSWLDAHDGVVTSPQSAPAAR